MQKTNSRIFVKLSVCLIAVCAVVLLLHPVCVWAVTTSGNWGENIHWVYDENTDTLTLSGSGRMKDRGSDPIPWSDNTNYPIKNLIIGDEITYICDYAFAQKTGITSITLPESVNEIGEFAFVNASFSCSVDLSHVKVIGESAFKGTIFPNTSLELTFYSSSQLTTISNNAFEQSNITGLFIEKSDVTIGEYAFQNCKSLTQVSLTGNHTIIKKQAFYNFLASSAIQRITIGGQGTEIGDQAFAISGACSAVSINSLTFQEGITKIGANAFSFVKSDSNITTITIPTTVTSIGALAFDKMTKLSTLYVLSSEVSIDVGSGGAPNSGMEIIYPAGVDVTGLCLDTDLDRVEFTKDGDNVSVVAIDGTYATTLGSVQIPAIPKKANPAGNYTITSVLAQAGVQTPGAPSDAAQITYQIVNDTVTITEMIKGTSSEIIIPASVLGKPVTKITAAVPAGVTLKHTHHFANGVCTLCGAAQSQAKDTPQQAGDTGSQETVAKSAREAAKLPSTLPEGTILAAFGDGKTFMSLKALNAPAQDIANQKLVARAAFGDKFEMLITKNIYAPYGIDTVWKNAARTLSWKDTGAKAGDTIYMVWYNQTSQRPVELIQAAVAADGTVSATLPSLGDVSTVSVIRVK